MQSCLIRPAVLSRDKEHGEYLQTVYNLLFRRLWHSFTSRTFKAQNKPVVAYQHRRFFKLRDSTRQMNNVTAPTASP